MKNQIVECKEYSQIERNRNSRFTIIWGLQILFLAFARYIMNAQQSITFVGLYMILWVILSLIAKYNVFYRLAVVATWLGGISWLVGLNYLFIGLGFISLGVMCRGKLYSLSEIFQAFLKQTPKVKFFTFIYSLSLSLVYLGIDLIIMHSQPQVVEKPLFRLVLFLLLGLSWLFKRWQMVSSEWFFDRSVLYLRSFDRDSETLNDDGGALDFIGHIINLSDQSKLISLRTLERCIWSVFKDDYHVNAIAKPKSDQRLIKSSTYHTDDAWQDAIEVFLTESQFVVCMLDITNGFAWEMIALRNRQAVGRTLFVFPANISLHQKNDLLEVLCFILGFEKVTLKNHHVAAFRFSSLEEMICYQSDCQSGYFSTMRVLKTALKDLEANEAPSILTTAIEAPRELKKSTD
jgi:hypothetical protein